VEGSKLCFFSMIIPAICVSSISPRFLYRRLAFCFLPLAAILESPRKILNCIKIKRSYLIVNISNVFQDNKTIWNKMFSQIENTVSQ
jgi:hypothetical protein